jgi:hypothetical protein
VISVPLWQSSRSLPEFRVFKPADKTHKKQTITVQQLKIEIEFSDSMAVQHRDPPINQRT